MLEVSRIIIGLRTAGWKDKAINDFILWVETGNEKYKPTVVRQNDPQDPRDKADHSSTPR